MTLMIVLFDPIASQKRIHLSHLCILYVFPLLSLSVSHSRKREQRDQNKDVL